MSENEYGAFGDEQKMLEYVYGDVDDSDIFATDPLNNSFSGSDTKAQADPATAPNPELIQENEALQETVEKLQKEKDILQLRISELYKTAKAELERKDRRLKELQNEKDNIVFRRGNIGNKPFSVDPRIPVLQQVEKNLINEESQNFITRYRIPKKISTADENQESSETKELHKKLEHNPTREEKCNRTSDDRPAISSTNNNGKDCDKHKEYNNKNPKDNNSSDRSRSREALDQGKPSNKGNGAFRSLSNNDKPSNEDCKQKNVQQRSKSSSRYKNDSPERYASKPKSPSRERQKVILNKRNRSKSMNEDVKCENTRMYSSSTSREKEQAHLLKARSKSPLYCHRSSSNDRYNKESGLARSKSSSRYKNVFPENRVGPRTPSVERERLPKKRYRLKSTNEGDNLEEKTTYSSSTSREREQVYLSRERSRSPPNDRCIRKASVPTRPREFKDMKLKDKNMSSPTYRQERYDHPSRDKSTSPSNEKVSTYNGVTKGSIPSKTSSSERHKPPYPKYYKINSRTPSVGREEGEFSDEPNILKEKETKFSINSTANENASRQHYSNSRSKSLERKCDIQSSRQTDRQEYGDKNKMYNKEAAWSMLQKKEDICASSRRNRVDSGGMCEDGIDDHKRRDIKPNCRRSCSPSSSRNKGSGNLKDQSEFKDSREIDKGFRDKIIDLREKVTERSRSGSCDRERKRVVSSRPISRERYSRRSERDDANRGRRFHQDRSNSSSTERDERQIPTNKAKSPIRRDQYGNVINYNRKNRSRSKSRGLRNRDGKSRTRYFGQLRERVLRYSMERGSQALRGRQGENKNADKNIHKNIDKNKGITSNQSDHSDLDELRLHLSGDSDQDSENNDHKKRRNEILNDLLISGDKDFEMVKDIGRDIQNMSNEDLERFLDMRKKVYNKLSNLSEDQMDINISPAVQFCSPIKKFENEINKEYNIQPDNVFSHCDNNMEELDYEPSFTKFPINLKRDRQEESCRLERKENESKEFTNTEIKHLNEQTPYEEKSTRCEKDKTLLLQESRQDEKGVDCDEEPVKTLFGLRQRMKSVTRYRGSEKSLNIIRNNAKFDLQEEPEVNIYKSSTESRKQSESFKKYKEDKIALKNCESNKEIQSKEITGETCDVFQYINNVKEAFVKVGQECNITRNKIANSLSNVTKGIDLSEKLLSEDPSYRMDVVSGKGENADQSKELRNEENAIENVTKKKREKITWLSYQSRTRTKSIDVRIDDIDLKDSDRIATNVSDNNETETNVPKKSDEETKSSMLQSNQELSLETTDLPVAQLPKAGEHIQQNYNIQGNDENIQAYIKNNASNKNSKDEVFVRNNEQIIPKISDTIIIQDEHDTPLGDNINAEEDAVKTELNNIIGDTSHHSKQENNCYHDQDSFINDFIVSDDDDENVTSSKVENMTVDSYKKINILSNITIQSPSYTPPHPKKSETILEGNVDLKEPGNTKSRKSLFKISVSPEETLNAVAHILETKDCNSDPLPLHSSTPENTPQIFENGPQTVEIDSGKTKSSIPPCARSKYLDELQEQVKTITGDTSPQYSSPGNLNTKTDHFDTEGLQKCLEEDITEPNAKISIKDAVAKEDKLSLETQNEVTKTGSEKNKIEFKQGRGEREVKSKKSNREHKHKKNKIADSPPHEFTKFDNKTMEDLFGPMTPSPYKAEEILSNIVRDKAKRNIIKSKKHNFDMNFKIKDKNEEANRNNKNKEVIKENENPESKSESKQKMVAVIAPEKSKQRLKKVDHKKIEGLKTFCTNPTYIPNIRDTPKVVFESPNHYIHKRNEEIKEKIKRNLIEGSSDNKIKTENVMQENIGCIEEIEGEENVDVVKKKHNNLSDKSIKTSSKEDFLVEDKCTKKTKPQKVKKKTKSKNSKDDVKMEDVMIILPKRGKIGLIEESKKNLKHSALTEEKKPRNPSFKIKINTAKKRLKVNAKENARKRRRSFDCNEDPDSIEEPRQEQTVKKVVSSNNKIKNKKANVVEEDRIEDSSVLPNRRGRPKKLIKTECHNEEESEKNSQEKMKEEQGNARLEEGQRDHCEENIEVQESKPIWVTIDRDAKESTKKIEKSSPKNETKFRKNCDSLQETSLKNIPNSSNESEGKPVKVIKRITPTKIGDCTLSKEKFQDLKAKRELFIENPESLLNSYKKRRLSSDSDNSATKKYQKVTYKESRTTVDEDVIDNAAQTRIKVQETQLSIEVAPNCSPLPRIEQTYDALSKNTALNKNDGNSSLSNSQFQPTYESVYPDIVLPATENTFHLINLDTKDLTMLGPVEKEFYYKNLSDFSFSGLGESKKNDKDSNDDNIGVERDKTKNENDQLSFTNFLNNKNPNTSTPIKNDQLKFVQINCNPKQYPAHAAVSRTDVKFVRSNTAPAVSSSSIAGTTVTTVCSWSSHKSNVSDNRTSSGMSSNVSSGNNVFKTHVKFSKTLKRDRRRPISMMVLD